MPPFLSDGELAGLRREVERTMDDRIQVLRPSSVADAGGEVTTYTVVAADVPCRIAPSDLRGGEQVIGGALQGVAVWRIVLRALTDVQKPDVIAQGGAFSGAGITDAQLRSAGTRLWQVEQVNGPRTIEIDRVVFGTEIG